MYWYEFYMEKNLCIVIYLKLIQFICPYYFLLCVCISCLYITVKLINTEAWAEFKSLFETQCILIIFRLTWIFYLFWICNFLWLNFPVHKWLYSDCVVSVFSLASGKWITIYWYVSNDFAFHSFLFGMK